MKKISRRDALKLTAAAGLPVLGDTNVSGRHAGEVIPTDAMILDFYDKIRQVELESEIRKVIRVQVMIGEPLRRELMYPSGFKGGGWVPKSERMEDIPIPTGDVTLCVGNCSWTTQPLDKHGLAWFTLDWLPSGIHGLQAIYPAQGGFGASRSQVWPLEVVDLIATETTLSMPEEICGGSEAVVTVTAADGSTPEGMVTLTFEGAEIRRGLTNGKAIVNLSVFRPGRCEPKIQCTSDGSEVVFPRVWAEYHEQGRYDYSLGYPSSR